MDTRGVLRSSRWRLYVRAQAIEACCLLPLPKLKRLGVMTPKFRTCDPIKTEFSIKMYTHLDHENEKVFWSLEQLITLKQKVIPFQRKEHVSEKDRKVPFRKGTRVSCL